MKNHYREMKEKYKIVSDDNMYLRYIDSVTSCMFDWDEKIFRPELLDRMIRDAGMAALIKTDTSDYTPVWFNPIDNGNGRYADGWFKDCVCFDFRGYKYDFSDWETNPDILVFWNTVLRSPDNFNEKYSTALTDIDYSILNNVHFSRMHPFPVARDKKTKNRIDAILKSISTGGDLETILMETDLKDIMENGDTVETINITDVEKSQYIQYLSQLHDRYIGRLYFMLGLGAGDVEKKAQVSIPELQKNDDASIVMAVAWYNARKQSFNKAKEKGHELSFDFSPIWKARVDSILNPPQSTMDENKEEESNEEEVEEDGSDGEESSDE